MNILIVNNSKIPATTYGGTERVIWYLGKALTNLGHNVTFLVQAGSYCPFARVLTFDTTRSINGQVPANIDVVHLNFTPDQPVEKPYIITVHGNRNDDYVFDKNSVFVSKNHADRFGSKSFVYNGLEWNDYGKPDLAQKRRFFHFLGDAAWRLKNVKGAIDVIKKTKREKLRVLGGSRLNFRMGFRLTLSPRVRFEGMVGMDQKRKLLVQSRGLIFPVKWHEPFGLALTESLYFGCPVFGTPYGSLPEIVHPAVGYLSANSTELSYHIDHGYNYSPRRCHEYARDVFDSLTMTKHYLAKYEQVLNGQPLNEVAPTLVSRQTVKFLPWQ